MIVPLVAAGLVQAAVVFGVTANTGVVTGAVITGAFLILNSILTIVLTRIIDRRETPKRRPRTRHKSDGDSSHRARRTDR